MKKNLLLILLLCGKLSSQVVFNSSSNIRCNSTKSFVNFAIGGGTLGAAPFSFTVVAPPCATNTIISSTSHYRSIPLSCAGIYTITIKDALNQNFGTYTHTVAEDNSINWKIYTTSNVDSICLGTAFVIGVADSSKYSFSNVNSNFLANNPIIPGTSTIVTVMPTITTTYTYNALFTNGTKTCTASDNKALAVVTSMNGGSMNCYNALLENTALSKLRIAPNPISTNFNIFFKPAELEIKRLTITNTLNQIIFTLNAPKAEQDIDISFLATGIYYMKAESATEQRTFKIIKE